MRNRKKYWEAEHDMKFVLASQNKHKLTEMQSILSAHGVEVVLQSDMGLHVDVEETGETFAENAMLKAQAVMKASGMMDGLSRLFRPVLCRLLPRACRDPDTLAALSGNVSANLLGLGNAATPLGIRAAGRMAKGSGGRATDELCTLVVLNTASIQLLPTTVAGVRGALGAESAFDILPAVWLASVLSVTAGLLAAKALGKIWRN